MRRPVGLGLALDGGFIVDGARLLKLNQQTIRNWIDAGTLPAMHVGAAGPGEALRLRSPDRGQLYPHGEPGEGRRDAEHLGGGHSRARRA
jgi:hypothetical protein